MTSNDPSVVKRLHSQRAVVLVFIGACLSSMSAFLIAPYLVTYLTGTAGFSVALAGSVIGISYWFLRASGFSASFLLRRFSIKQLMIGGSALRTLGYLPLLTGNVPLIVAGMIAIGIGAGIYFPLSKTYLNQVLPAELQLAGLSWRNAYANTGVALGPILGLTLLDVPVALVLTATGIFTLLTAAFFWLPTIQNAARPSSGGHLATYGRVLRSSTVVSVILVSFAIGGVLIQLESLLPLWARRHDALPLVAVVFTLNAVLVVVGQAVGVFVVSRLRTRLVLAIGSIAIVLGLGLFEVTTLVWAAWLVAALGISAGEIVLGLSNDNVLRRFELHEQVAAYGIVGLFDATGGLLGGILGGFFFAGWKRGALPAGPFAAVAAIASIVLIIAVIFARHPNNETKVAGVDN